MTITNINFKANVQENGTELNKQKGRLVIGIEGTHTLDDVDILFGRNEADGAENSAKLEAAIQKGGFTEIVFLEGTFYISRGFSFNGIIRGRGCNESGYYNDRNYKGTYIVADSSNSDMQCIITCANTTICDLTLSHTDSHADVYAGASRFGIWCEHAENIFVERVTFQNLAHTAIHFADGNNIRISKCTFRENADESIYVANCNNVTITECISSYGVRIIGGTDDTVHLISNNFSGDVTMQNCYAVNNKINGTVSSDNNFTTIGATKLTEDKVKQLNKIPDDLGLSTTGVIDTGDYIILSGMGTALFYETAIWVISISGTVDASAEYPKTFGTGLFVTNGDETETNMIIYPRYDDFDFGTITVLFGGGDLYVRGESRLMEFLADKNITFTRIL